MSDIIMKLSIAIAAGRNLSIFKMSIPFCLRFLLMIWHSVGEINQKLPKIILFCPARAYLTLNPLTTKKLSIGLIFLTNPRYSRILIRYDNFKTKLSKFDMIRWFSKQIIKIWYNTIIIKAKYQIFKSNYQNFVRYDNHKTIKFWINTIR